MTLTRRGRIALWLCGIALVCFCLTSCGKAAQTAAKVAKSKTARRMADAALTAASYYDKVAPHLPKADPRFKDAVPVGERFPDLRLVQLVPGTRSYFDESTRLFVQPNTLGGWCFSAENGEPVGFSAYHRASGSLHYFDALGCRLQ